MAKGTSLQTIDQNILQSLIINGDISQLNGPQRVQYYKVYCERLGLDPLTQPFKILVLNGKHTLYCDRSGVQQLSKLHKVSHEIKAREISNDCYVVTAQARTEERVTESIGAVPINNLSGERLCNAMMKAETKAKRRATLDLLGLGILDETEVETIPGAQTMDITHEEMKDDKHDDAVNKAIEEVNKCKSWEDMAAFADKYPESILKDQRFRDAATSVKSKWETSNA